MPSQTVSKACFLARAHASTYCTCVSVRLPDTCVSVRYTQEARQRLQQALLRESYGDSCFSYARAKCRLMYESRGFQSTAALFIVLAFVIDVAEAQVSRDKAHANVTHAPTRCLTCPLASTHCLTCPLARMHFEGS